MRLLLALSVFMVLAVLLSTAATPSSASAGGVTYHTVRPGESLGSIAAMYDTSPYAITQANGISNPNLIYAGQVLVIPVPAHGYPVYGQPVYGQPVYGQPAYVAPVHVQPVYVEPVYMKPVYVPPAYGNPGYWYAGYGYPPCEGHPGYGHPGYGYPSHGYPDHGCECYADP